MRKINGVSAGIAMLVLAFSVSQCSKKYNTPVNTTPPVVYKTVGLQANPTLGNYLIDNKGRALYFFANDVNGFNHCAGIAACALLWSPYTEDPLTADAIDARLNLRDFSNVQIQGGPIQLTYKGWPLYTYTPSGTPEAPGQVGGDAVGGIWFVAKPDYTIMLGNDQMIGNDGNHYKSDYSVGDGATIWFTDAVGRTLYAFKKDSANHNKFTKSDFSNDPIFPSYDTAGVAFPSILDKSQFSTTDVFGRSQLTYKGWPLYHAAVDSNQRGNTRAISNGGAGVVWQVMTKDFAPAPRP
jgi:predicted lipoprotein with Yx(FWY)xxD motif